MYTLLVTDFLIEKWILFQELRILLKDHISGLSKVVYKSNGLEMVRG